MSTASVCLEFLAKAGARGSSHKTLLAGW